MLASKVVTGAVLAAALAAAACEPEGEAASPELTTDPPPLAEADASDCPQDLPMCPATPPSYAMTVDSIIQKTCFPCHAPGGVADANRDMSTYANVYKIRGLILDQIYACKMPPPVPGLSSVERLELLEWLVCGAPNN